MPPSPRYGSSVRDRSGAGISPVHRLREAWGAARSARHHDTLLMLTAGSEVYAVVLSAPSSLGETNVVRRVRLSPVLAPTSRRFAELAAGACGSLGVHPVGRSGHAPTTIRGAARPDLVRAVAARLRSRRPRRGERYVRGQRLPLLLREGTAGLAVGVRCARTATLPGRAGIDLTEAADVKGRSFLPLATLQWPVFPADGRALARGARRSWWYRSSRRI